MKNLQYLNYLNKANPNISEIDKVLGLDKLNTDLYIENKRCSFFMDYNKGNKLSAYDEVLLESFISHRYNIPLKVKAFVYDSNNNKIIQISIHDENDNFIINMEFDNKMIFDILDSIISSHSFKIDNGYKKYKSHRFWDIITKKPIFLNEEFKCFSSENIKHCKRFEDYNKKKYSRIIDLRELKGEKNEHIFILDGLDCNILYDNNNLIFNITPGSFYNTKTQKLITIDKNHSFIKDNKNVKIDKNEKINFQNKLFSKNHKDSNSSYNILLFYDDKDDMLKIYTNSKYNKKNFYKHEDHLNICSFNLTYNEKTQSIKKFSNVLDRSIEKNIEFFSITRKIKELNNFKYFIFKFVR